MPSTTGRILIITSYNGRPWDPKDLNTRHNTGGITPAEMLRIQYAQLSKLSHTIDKVLIVVNETTPDSDYEEALKLFSNQLRRANDQGSYGGWRDAYFANPNYEWYFFLEDDYTFFQDNFDQTMIDMWGPNTSFLAERIDGNHASISNGLARQDSLKAANWSFMNAQRQYDNALQMGWSSVFNSAGLRDITGMYDSPFWTGSYVKFFDQSKPILIGPMQAL